MKEREDRLLFTLEGSFYKKIHEGYNTTVYLFHDTLAGNLSIGVHNDMEIEKGTTYEVDVAAYGHMREKPSGQLIYSNRVTVVNLRPQTKLKGDK